MKKNIKVQEKRYSEIELSGQSNEELSGMVWDDLQQDPACLHLTMIAGYKDGGICTFEKEKPVRRDLDEFFSELPEGIVLLRFVTIVSEHTEDE
ncbi:MAG: hypothetical protein IJT12_09195 [Paludibacteraceae bacterium]|nr:hypothetical protein [Paludibacteraceae bacterium]